MPRLEGSSIFTVPPHSNARNGPAVHLRHMPQWHAPTSRSRGAAVRAASARAASGKETLEASITLPGDPGEPIRGSLSFLDNEVEGETGTLRLRATVANADGRCWPGRFARVRLVLETRLGLGAKA